MQSKPVKKVNIPYALAYFLIPIVLIFLCGWLSVRFFPKGTMAVVLLMGPTALSFVWWIFGGKAIFKKNLKAFQANLQQSGFVRNSTFTSGSLVVMVDAEHGELAMLFLWNPTCPYRVPASRISKLWVDDGASGSGFMRGSSRVSFLFTVDGTKVRVNTFTSNKRWRMDSDYILTGISKADAMVEVLEAAQKRSV